MYPPVEAQSRAAQERHDPAPKHDSRFQGLAVPPVNECRKYSLVAAERHAEEIHNQYLVLNCLAEPSIIGRIGSWPMKA